MIGFISLIVCFAAAGPFAGADSSAASPAPGSASAEVAACALDVTTLALMCFDFEYRVILRERLNPPGDTAADRRAAALTALGEAGLVVDHEEGPTGDGGPRLILVPRAD